MEHQRYLTRRRARFEGIGGKVNLPYGTVLYQQGGFIFHGKQRVCAVGSQNALDFFVQDDDGAGRLRGKLVDCILTELERKDSRYQERWNRVWESALCNKYRRSDSADFWLWSRAFYDAPLLDLRAIAALVTT